ncbi:hypothetical protein ODJ79_19130 [Actinoplanes sp. KI2]|uniref:hypothetical protein n=1 Tax=Actinoplanes sp. KI2 TaxID=2983315 RepID=UPI0021D5E0B2|nr:hypothetical protein [Actinoplanes sp. KI2]MCU7725848.1 hypothetical protein [Actinoplanes sp. KI2]
MSQPPYSGPPYGQPSSGDPSPGQPPYGQQPQYGQPQYGQPQYGQPQYGQPEYGQPQYPGQPNPDVPPTQAYPDYGQQPQYGQPQYGQPQYGQPEYAQPGYPPPAPPQKSRTLPIVLTIIGIVLVLCVGGGTAVALIVKNDQNKKNTADTSSTTAPTQATDEPTPDQTTETTPPATKVTIAAPKTLGGRPKLTDKELAGLTDSLKTALGSVPGATNPVGALYGTISNQDIVVLAAAQADVDDPATMLDLLFTGASSGAGKVTGVTTAPTGSLGGSAKCGLATDSGTKMALCTWADSGSIGMLIWYDKSVAKAKAEFPRLRAQVEKQG